MIFEVIVFIFTVVAVITDIKYKKVFNKITFPLMIIGLTTNLFLNGLNGLMSGLLGLVSAFGLFMIANILIRNIGFGDVKLLMGIGTCMGWEYIASVYIVALVSSIIVQIITNPKKIYIAIRKIYNMFMTMLLSKKPQFIDFENNKETYIFAPYILIGCIVSSWVCHKYNLNLIEMMIK